VWYTPRVWWKAHMPLFSLSNPLCWSLLLSLLLSAVLFSSSLHSSLQQAPFQAQPEMSWCYFWQWGWETPR
jgi:hypothetical protein